MGTTHTQELQMNTSALAPVVLAGLPLEAIRANEQALVRALARLVPGLVVGVGVEDDPSDPDEGWRGVCWHAYLPSEGEVWESPVRWLGSQVRACDVRLGPLCLRGDFPAEGPFEVSEAELRFEGAPGESRLDLPGILRTLVAEGLVAPCPDALALTEKV